LGSSCDAGCAFFRGGHQMAARPSGIRACVFDAYGTLTLGGNLAVPIAAHGVTDTVDLVLLFLHRYPACVDA
jgi:hypothetical protein